MSNTIKIMMPGQYREATEAEIASAVKPIKSYECRNGQGYDLADGTFIEPVGDGNYHARDGHDTSYVELSRAEFDEDGELVGQIESLGFVQGRC